MFCASSRDFEIMLGDEFHSNLLKSCTVMLSLLDLFNMFSARE